MAKRASNKPHLVDSHGYRWVETGVMCPGCNQQISCDLTDQPGALECGGPGDGICSAGHIAFSLGSPGWQRELREFKDLFPKAKAPTLVLCERIVNAFNKADKIGKPYLAKANPRRR